MFLGLLLAISCGVCWGIFLAPMRFLKGWAWENIWLVWSVIALLLGPLAVAISTVPRFTAVNQDVGVPILLFTVVIGAVCGLAGFVYSFTVPIIGLGLAAALQAGGSLAMSLLPLVVLYSNTILEPSGALTALGVFISMLGIWSCGKGGRLREFETAQSSNPGAHHTTMGVFLACLAFNVVTGALSSGMNVVLSFPALNPISDVAHRYGSSDFAANNAFMAPYLIGGFLTNFVYAAYRLYKNDSISNYYVSPAISARCLLWTVLMAAVFLAGTFSYVGAVARLGNFGSIITWALSTAAMILASSAWDVAHGEWKGKAAHAMAVGVQLLIAAIIVLGLAQYFHQIAN